MHTFYPPIKPNRKWQLNVTPPHVLYVEECGNPDGLPVLVLHTGPGAGSDTYYRRFFDPEVYRIILFDQRGAGRSKPHAELEHNTTADLIADMEAIRKDLNIERWVLFGNAWGSTLALAYGIEHPDRVIAFILGSVFLGRDQDIAWIYRDGVNAFFPDYWNEFLEPLNPDEQVDPLKAYHNHLTCGDELSRMSAAKSWSKWQVQCSTFKPNHKLLDHFAEPHLAIGLACIENFYFLNNCFLKENYILDNIDKVKNIDGYLIHGRYNVITPLENAWNLHQAWPQSQIYIVREAGHEVQEATFVDALITATREVAKTHNKLA
jgi:proline iminopeptidase